MVFICLGTQGNQFPRFLDMVEELIHELHPQEDFVAQIGHTKYESDDIKLLDFVPEVQFKEYIKKANVVLTHAGSGALFNAIKSGKKTIAVARLHQYNEMVNDHQTELVRKLASEGYILDGTYSVLEAWRKIDGFVPRECDFQCSIPNAIDDLLKIWIG